MCTRRIEMLSFVLRERQETGVIGRRLVVKTQAGRKSPITMKSSFLQLLQKDKHKEFVHSLINGIPGLVFRRIFMLRIKNEKKFSPRCQISSASFSIKE
jgi:hypothetical protein